MGVVTWRSHVRGILVLFHVLAVLVLATPSPWSVGRRAAWETPNAKTELATWANRLQRVGVETSGPQLSETLWDITRAYLSTRRVVAAPFAPYAAAFGLEQGWSMFTSPNRHPGRLRVAVRAGADWRTVYLSRSAEHAWARAQFDHARTRKLVGRLIRYPNRARFQALATWAGRRALADHPHAAQVRVSIERGSSLAASEIRAGQVWEPRPRESLTVDREALE